MASASFDINLDLPALVPASVTSAAAAVHSPAVALAPNALALHAGAVPRIVIDYDPPQPDDPQLASDSSDLVYFLSWAFSTRYGANHEMSIAALVLRGEFGIDLSPLLTFADRSIEDPADADALARAWQDAVPLAECCTRVAEALRDTEKRLTAIREEYPGLVENIEELARLAGQAAERGARIRVTYELEH